MSKLFVDLHIALRNLIQHSRRTLFLGTAIGAVTALLVLLNGLSTGIRETMIDTATTLSTGHLNVGGFYKITAGQAGAGRHRLPEGAGRREEVAARDGLRRRARSRLGEAGLRHRLDAGRHQRHRHPPEPRLPQVLQIIERQPRRSRRAEHDPDLREAGQEAGRRRSATR